MRVLMWLHFAYRPLKLRELQHALAVERGDTEFDSENISSQKVLLDCCLGLVVVDEETLTVRFVHYTLEEYFRTYSKEEFPNGCSSIAETCLTYLNFREVKQNCTSTLQFKDKVDEYTFLNYAAHYWGTYVHRQCNDDLVRLARMLVHHEIGHPPCGIQALFYQLYHWRGIVSQKFSGIHATAYFGLCENMARFCEEGHNIDLKDDYDQTPLLWVAKSGHGAVVRLLIDRGDADINAKDRDGQTPLSLAAQMGHEAVVRLLIDRGDVDINAKNRNGWTPLTQAAKKGHEAVVWLLIGRGDVDINAKDKYGQTPLMFAAQKGNEAVVRLLIDRGDVDINAKDLNGQTPLTCAAQDGHEVIVRLLIGRSDVDINAKDCNGWTPLTWAAREGHEAIVQLLIGRGDVDINAKDRGGRTPLTWAAQKGYEAVVRLLIHRGDVDIDAEDSKGQTPLQLAAESGYEAVVSLLRRHEALSRDPSIAPI